MAADATGTPTSPDSIPKYNTSVDAPSGNGFNAAMDQIQAIITQLKAGTLASGKILLAGLTSGATGQVINNVAGTPAWAYPESYVGAVNLSAANIDYAFPGVSAALNTVGITTGGGSVRSISAPIVNGQHFKFKNYAGGAVTFKHALAGGTGAQLNLRGSVDCVLATGETLDMFYDGTNWSEVSRNLLTGITQICDLTLGGAQASFDTNTILGGNIPAIYNHLKIVVQGRTSDASTAQDIRIQFNNDSGANYGSETVQGNTATPNASENASATSGSIGAIPGSLATANHAGGNEIIIPNYRGTTFFKNAIGLMGFSAAITTTSLFVSIKGCTWASTAAITRVAVFPVAGNFVTGTRFTLYGII